MEPKYVTFEQAVWLNNQIQSNKVYDNGVLKKKPSFSMGCISDSGDRYKFAPEQHQVVDWLLEKHGIFVEVFADDTEESHNDWIYLYNITMTRKKGESRIWIDGPDKDSPKEAYSAAFDYIKNNNLI